MTHFAIQMTDGSVTILQTVGRVSPEECLAKWHPDERAKVHSCHAIDPAIIPKDRTFRGAWTFGGAAITHDMAKAREITRARLRRERVPVLAALDVEYQRADEIGDQSAKAAIIQRKQLLRDAPSNPAIDAAKTVGDLTKIILPRE